MISTTLDRIWQNNPCEEGWNRLATTLGVRKYRDLTDSKIDTVTLHEFCRSIPMSTILKSNGIGDALWCVDKTANKLNRVKVIYLITRHVVPHMPDELAEVYNHFHKQVDALMMDVISVPVYDRDQCRKQLGTIIAACHDQVKPLFRSYRFNNMQENHAEKVRMLRLTDIVMHGICYHATDSLHVTWVRTFAYIRQYMNSEFVCADEQFTEECFADLLKFFDKGR